jgi:hypothetical protein
MQRNAEVGLFTKPSMKYLKHFCKKQEGIKGLILGRWGDISFYCQMGKKLLYLRNTHILGMSFVMKIYISGNPSNIGLYRSDDVMLASQYLPCKI